METAINFGLEVFCRRFSKLEHVFLTQGLTEIDARGFIFPEPGEKRNYVPPKLGNGVRAEFRAGAEDTWCVREGGNFSGPTQTFSGCSEQKLEITLHFPLD